MKRKIITLAAASSLALGVFTFAQAHDAGEGRHGRKGRGDHEWRNPLSKLDEKLDLTAEQKAKVQPIVEQTKPQIAAIHQEAMQRSKAVFDAAMVQIRPLLTAEQQTKLDAMQKAHEEKLAARQKRREAKSE